MFRDQLDIVIDAAVNHPEGAIPRRLLTALRRNPAAEAAAMLLERLPPRSLALADLALELANQAVAHQRQLALQSSRSHSLPPTVCPALLLRPPGPESAVAGESHGSCPVS